MIDLYQLRDSGTLFDGRYELIEPIGRGGFASVWRVKDTRSRVDVVLKVYDGVDKEGERLFREEFALVYSLNHTNILTPSYYDVVQGSPYIVMALCEKGAATKLIGKADERQVWDFVYQVASGLKYIHDHDIIHKDIKPANILINGEDQYMISDFGISTKLRNTMRRTQNGADGSGTIAYMPYETLKRNPVDSFSRDIWAFGASVYEIMTGDVPFGDYGGITQNANGGKIPKIEGDGVSSELKNLVYKCLSMNPWERPSAKEILLYKQQKPAPKPRKWKRIVVAATIAGIVGGGAYTIIQLSDIQKPIKTETSKSEGDSTDTPKVEYAVISQIGKANKIVASEEGIRKAYQRNAGKLIAAAKMYRGALSLSKDSDSLVINKYKEMWNHSQKVIDETYASYIHQASEYDDAGAYSAKKRMSKNVGMLDAYVSASARKQTPAQREAQ